MCVLYYIMELNKPQQGDTLFSERSVGSVMARHYF